MTVDEQRAPGPGPRALPDQGLRARKKAATMRRVQAEALALFDQRGFDAVSIEEVARAAEVSPSTVYRYFGTKEGLVVHDEYDDRFLELLAHYLGQGLGLTEVMGRALDGIWEEHFVADAEPTWRRTRWVFEVPSVQAAVWVLVNEKVDEIARVLADSGRYPFARARVLASATVWAVVAVLRTWYEAGGTGDLRAQMEEVLGWLSRVEGPEAAGPAAR